jgi:hypothetical protein
LVVPIGDKHVVALLFQTDRAPFVVNAKDGFLEVPWREGTRTNSARRSDLIRLLTPTVRIPDFEVMEAKFRCTEEETWEDSGENEKIRGKHYLLEFSFLIYVLPKDHQRVVFPFHGARCSVLLQGGDYRESQHIQFEMPMDARWGEKFITNPMNPPPMAAHSETIRMSASEMIVDGPGSFLLRSKGHVKNMPSNLPHALMLTVMLKPAGSKVGALLSSRVSQAIPDDRGGTLWVGNFMESTAER